MSTRLHITGLPGGYDEDDLLDLCEPFGEINDLEVLYQQGPVRDGCSALVDYYDFDDARCAAEELNGAILEGRRLRVSFVSGSREASTFD